MATNHTASAMQRPYGFGDAAAGHVALQCSGRPYGFSYISMLPQAAAQRAAPPCPSKKSGTTLQGRPRARPVVPPERRKLVPIPERHSNAASRTPQISANPALASICGVQQADDESSLQVINHLPGLLQQAKGNPSKGTPHFYANPGKALKCGLPKAANQCQSRKGIPLRTSRRGMEAQRGFVRSLDR